MTLKMSVYYAAPEDPDAFESRYLEGHLPLAKSYPNIKHASFHKVGRKLIGDFAYAYVFTGTWEDKDAWKADMGSPESDKVNADADTFNVERTVVLYDQLA
jgi:uncharacterized protein (TIGR02118 family)